MKKFLLKISLFLFVPVICWTIIEAIIPPTTFTHRHYEALTFDAQIPSETYWYPNIQSSMRAMGDLSHHTSKSVLKNEIWKTDKLGYRNDEFVEEADVLFLGDSFAVGTGLSQEEIISNRVRAQFQNKLKVYNMSPNSFSGLDQHIKTGKIKKPKLIVFSIVERNTPDALVPFTETKSTKIKAAFKKLFATGGLNIYLSKAFKFNSVKWMIARLHNSTGTGIPGEENPDMFFLNGTSKKRSNKDLRETAETIISYKKYCDSLGINFIFVPMPDKETVYYESVGFKKQPNYLNQLDSLLNIAHVSTVNTLEIYNNYRKTNKELLYHLDDTHWNGNATALISKEIAKKIRKANQEELAVILSEHPSKLQN